MKSYIYPEVYIPIEGKTQPDIDKVNEEIRKWAFDFKLYEKESGAQQYKREQLVRFACQCFPDGDYQRTLVMAKFMIQAFVLDDEIEERRQCKYADAIMKHGQSIKNLTALLDNAALDKDAPTAVTFADFWEDAKRLSNKSWQNRFAANYTWFLKWNTWEVNNVDLKRVPPLAEYLEFRHYSGCVDACLNFIELTRNIFLPDEILANPTLQRLSHLAGNVFGYINDLYSFEKERRSGEVNNIVISIKHEYNISYQEAINIAVKIINEEMKKYLVLEPFIPSFGGEMDKCVSLYLEGLRHFMRGNYDWCSTTGRYPRLEYPDDEF